MGLLGEILMEIFNSATKSTLKNRTNVERQADRKISEMVRQGKSPNSETIERLNSYKQDTKKFNTQTSHFKNKIDSIKKNNQK